MTSFADIIIIGVFGAMALLIAYALFRPKFNIGPTRAAPFVRHRPILITKDYGIGEVVGGEMMGNGKICLALRVEGKTRSPVFVEDEIVPLSVSQILFGETAPQWIERSIRGVYLDKGFNRQEIIDLQEKLAKKEQEKESARKREKQVTASQDRKMDWLSDTAAKLAGSPKRAYGRE